MRRARTTRTTAPEGAPVVSLIEARLVRILRDVAALKAELADVRKRLDALELQEHGQVIPFRPRGGTA